VAAVQHADGQVHAIQITYLATAQPRKAGVTDPRETVGPLGDGAVGDASFQCPLLVDARRGAAR
jgi:hypothetical protein